MTRKCWAPVAAPLDSSIRYFRSFSFSFPISFIIKKFNLEFFNLCSYSTIYEGWQFEMMISSKKSSR